MHKNVWSCWICQMALPHLYNTLLGQGNKLVCINPSGKLEPVDNHFPGRL